jgi:hypothetical protein
MPIGTTPGTRELRGRRRRYLARSWSGRDALRLQTVEHLLAGAPRLLRPEGEGATSESDGVDPRRRCLQERDVVRNLETSEVSGADEADRLGHATVGEANKL